MVLAAFVAESPAHRRKLQGFCDYAAKAGWIVETVVNIGALGQSITSPDELDIYDGFVIDIPAEAGPADALAEADLDPALLRDAEGVSVEVSAECEKIVRGNRDWFGLKIQLHWIESGTGREGWENIPNVSGTFPPRLVRNDAWFKGARPDKATLQLGLQGASGRVVFDLSTLRGGRGLGLFRPLNQDKRVAYPERVSRDVRRRGFMLPGRDPTEDDFATLAE